VAVLLENVPAQVPHRKETVAQLTLNLNKINHLKRLLYLARIGWVEPGFCGMYLE
jgi:hypothetical protein